jgi:hypothetical protein
MNFIVTMIDKPLPIRRNAINYYTNKILKKNISIKKNEIIVYSKLSYEEIYRAIQREKCEAYYLRKGYSYKEAHKISRNIECLGIDFPDELMDIKL